MFRCKRFVIICLSVWALSTRPAVAIDNHVFCIAGVVTSLGAIATAIGLALSMQKEAVAVEVPKTVITVDDSIKLSREIPSDFASFSIEPICAKKIIMNDNMTGVRTAYINLMSFLKNTSRGLRGPNLRIGGNSADQTYFSNNSSEIPSNGNMYRLDDTDVKAFAHAKDWGGTVTIDLNLAHTNGSHVLDYVDSVVRYIDPATVAGYEFGNEPDIYPHNGVRNSNYNYLDYRRDFKNLLGKVSALIKHPFVQGAVYVSSSWTKKLVDYYEEFSSSLSSISVHSYPMSAAVATIPRLLGTPAASRITSWRSHASLAAAHGIPFVIGEGNSAYGGGSHGVSDTFAATLWSIDTMFWAVSANISRWNFHGCTSGSYSPIINTNTDSAHARPVYYGQWFFTEATSNGAKLVQSTTKNNFPSSIQSWSTVSSDRLNIVILNKNANQTSGSQSVSVRVDRKFSGMKARVRRLFPGNKAIDAKYGIVFGGQTFDGSKEGFPRGVPTNESVVVDTNGNLQVTLHFAEAILIDISY